MFFNINFVILTLYQYCIAKISIKKETIKTLNNSFGFGIRENVNGRFEISQIQLNSPASFVNLQIGDLLVALNENDLTT